MLEQITNKNRNRLVGAGIVVGLGAGAVAAYMLARRNGVTRENIFNGARQAVRRLDTMPTPTELIQTLASRALDFVGQSTNGNAQQSRPTPTMPPAAAAPEGPHAY